MIVKLKVFSFLLVLLSSGFAPQVIAADTALVEAGSQVYTNRCLHCHGPNGQGDGSLIAALKVKPADLSVISQNGCVAKKVLAAVLGRHKTGDAEIKMPPLKEVLTIEKVYAVSAYIETLQK